jgi:co-chaperonin GroES (HSP10)
MLKQAKAKSDGNGKAKVYKATIIPPILPPEPHPLTRCKPRGDRVVIRRDMPEEVTGGGIILPATMRNANQQVGTVLFVGPKVTDIQAGDRVLITGYAGLEVKTGVGSKEDNEYVILREEDVLALLDF